MAVAAPVRSSDELRAMLRRYGELPGLSLQETDAKFVRQAAQEEADGDAKNAVMLRKRCESVIGFTEYHYHRYFTRSDRRAA